MRRSLLVVDDHPIFRQGISRILGPQFPEIDVSEAADATAAFGFLGSHRCDLILLDLTLPGEHGLPLLRRLRREYPGVPVLIVTMHAPEQFAQRALLGGAVGYVTKDAGAEDLIAAVGAALADEPLPPSTGGTHSGTEPQPLPPHETLSDREYQVLRMIGMGRSVSQIGAELALSVKTVSTYRSRILEKLQLHTTAELMHYAIVNRLVGVGLAVLTGLAHGH
jgi:two-component system invasion response regulator UvrY